MTADPIDFTEGSVSIDFTNPNLAVWGQNARILLDSNTPAMWAGNANMDNQLIFQGLGVDNDQGFLDVLSAPGNNGQTNYVLSGYYASDSQLDGRVIFQGLDNDNDIRFYNILLHKSSKIIARQKSFVLRPALKLIRYLFKQKIY